MGATLGVQVDGEGGRVGRAVDGPGEETVVGFWAGIEDSSEGTFARRHAAPQKHLDVGALPKASPTSPTGDGVFGRESLKQETLPL